MKHETRETAVQGGKAVQGEDIPSDRLRPMMLLAVLCVAGQVYFIATAWLLPLMSEYTLVGDNISELAIGRYGYLQTAAFAAAGIGALALAMGVRWATSGSWGSRAGSVLVALFGVGPILLGLAPTAAVRDFRRVHPGVRVDVRRLEWADQRTALLEGRVDVSLGRLPLDGEGLCVEALREEPRVVLLPADHPLADKEELSILDVADEPVVRHVGPPAAWDAFWAHDPRPDGSRVVWGPVVTGVEEKLEQVAAGQAVTILPLSAGTSTARPDVRAVPLHDVPVCTVVLAWPDDGRAAPLRTSFLASARRTLS